MDAFGVLVSAVMDGDRAAIDRALREVPDVNHRPIGDGSAALHYAAQEHSVAGIRALLEAGADVDLPDANGNTALHYATFDRTEDDEAIRLLRAAGADPAGASNRHPGAFDGDSVVAAYDDHGVVLRVAEDGRLAGLRRPWADTYHPNSAGDWEHVFCELPEPLMVPVTLAWEIGRLPVGSMGRPVQLAVIKVDALTKPFPAPDDPQYAAEGYDTLGHVTRLPVPRVTTAIATGRIADLETVALLFAIQHEIHHGLS